MVISEPKTRRVREPEPTTTTTKGPYKGIRKKELWITISNLTQDEKRHENYEN